MLFGLLISSPRNVWVCGSKGLGHFNTVIIIIIEIKQHSSFWRQFSVGCRRLRLPVIIYGLHICLDFVLLLQLAAGIMKLANCGTADMGKGR